MTECLRCDVNTTYVEVCSQCFFELFCSVCVTDDKGKMPVEEAESKVEEHTTTEEVTAAVVDVDTKEKDEMQVQPAECQNIVAAGLVADADLHQQEDVSA